MNLALQISKKEVFDILEQLCLSPKHKIQLKSEDIQYISKWIRNNLFYWPMIKKQFTCWN